MEEIAESDIKSLLNEVRLIKEKSDAVLDATGGRFNIFKILDVNQHENTHSKIIASFLNPNGKHGLKDLFLALFLCACFSDDELRDFEFNTKNAKVITESFAPADDKNGRIDILVKSGAKGIIIENKFLAGDQPSQLKRYDEWARKNLTAGYKILYLTKDGHKASEQSGNGVDYTPISYKEEIIDWLEDCFSKSAAFPLVRETLVQYLNLIKHYMGRSMSAMTQKEIISLLGSEENIKTVKLIAKNYDKVLKAKATELFEEMDKIVTQNFGNKKFEKQVRSKAGDKDFLIRYIFSDIGDVNLCILFEPLFHSIRGKTHCRTVNIKKYWISTNIAQSITGCNKCQFLCEYLVIALHTRQQQGHVKRISSTHTNHCTLCSGVLGHIFLEAVNELTYT